MEILLTPLYDTTKNKTKTMSGITTKKNRRKSSLIITELPSPTNKIIVQDVPMAKDGIMEKPDASSENKMISDKNLTKETLPSKLPIDDEKGTDITKTENALATADAETKKSSYYQMAKSNSISR